VAEHIGLMAKDQLSMPDPIHLTPSMTPSRTELFDLLFSHQPDFCRHLGVKQSGRREFSFRCFFGKKFLIDERLNQD
jgi:hypothetical protein